MAQTRLSNEAAFALREAVIEHLSMMYAESEGPEMLDKLEHGRKPAPGKDCRGAESEDRRGGRRGHRRNVVRPSSVSSPTGENDTPE